MSILIQIRKYLTVGLGSAVTDYAIYGLLLSHAGMSPELANLISRPCGGLFSFAGNKLWTFGRRKREGTGRELARFWVIWLIAYGASEALVWAFHSHFRHHSQTPLALAEMIHHLTGLRPDMVKVLPKVYAECLIGIGLFLTHRFWTFRHK